MLTPDDCILLIGNFRQFGVNARRFMQFTRDYGTNYIDYMLFRTSKSAVGRHSSRLALQFIHYASDQLVSPPEKWLATVKAGEMNQGEDTLVAKLDTRKSLILRFSLVSGHLTLRVKDE